MAMVRQDAGYDLVTVTPTGIEARLWGAHTSNIFEFYSLRTKDLVKLDRFNEHV